MNKQFFERLQELQNEKMVMENQILPFIHKFVDSKVNPEILRCRPKIKNILIVHNSIEVTTFEVDIWGDECEFTYTADINYFIKNFCR